MQMDSTILYHKGILKDKKLSTHKQYQINT